MTRPTRDLKWSVERRLRFIELRLYWEGTLNRGDLTERFGISTQQASADIALYQERARRNCEYDRAAKTYVARDTFKPIFGGPDPHTYLNELRSLGNGLTTATQSWVGTFPSFDTVPYPKRKVDPETLRLVLWGIRAGKAIEVQYVSLSRPEPFWRWITPHALGYDGHRWHARAFCHDRGNFLDFVLSRILEAGDTASHTIDPGYDRQWNEEVELEIGTHPELPVEHRRAVELDYGMDRGRLTVPTRAALFYYLLRWMRIDLEPGVVSPAKQQIWLVNKEDLEAKVDELKVAAGEELAAMDLERFSARKSSGG